MIKYGQISDVDYAKNRVRVAFEDDGITSDWLAVIVPQTATNSWYFSPQLGDFVACIMDERLENGVVLGAIYAGDTAPKEGGEGLYSVVFEDGSKVVFDANDGSLSVETTGSVSVKAEEVTIESAKTVTVKGPNGITLDGDTTVRGGLSVTQNAFFNGDIGLDGGLSAQGVLQSGTDVTALGKSLVTHIHTAPSGGGPTTPPI